jgi:TP901 family phage tail tape measure protein
MANTEKIVVQVVVQGQKDLQRLEKRTGSTTKSFGRMAAGVLGAVTAFRQMASMVSNAIRSFRDFEFQMAKVKAITGASNTDFKKLSQTAQDLGRSTFFTAQQVAELQTNFGKLGFSTQEILDAQEATLNLATATDSDLARAAVVAGAAVRGFGLNAKETGRVTDVMASAFTSSALDLEKFQTSMTKVAPIAAGANISLEATTAVMGTLTDAGIEASIAGTSLRNIFLKMQDPASDLSQHLGFTVNSSDDLERALQQLNAEGLSNAEMMQLVDLRQVAAFQTMIRGAERVSFLTKQFNLSNGAAEDMANTVGDTLEGAFKRLVSATEGLQIAFMGTGGGLTNFINRIADFTNRITDSIAPQETQIEMLQRTTQEMDSQFSLLTEGNLSQDARVQIIQNLNTEYADYLPHLISEKDGLEDIKDMQLEVNNLMMERILIMAMEEELAELAEKQAKAVKGQINSQIGLAKIKQDNLTTDDAIIKSNKVLEQSTKDIMTVNEHRIENAEKDKELLIEGYKETAKQLGLSVENIMSALRTQQEEETETTNTSTTAIEENNAAKKTSLDLDREILDFKLNEMMEGNLNEEQRAEVRKQLIQQEINDLKKLLNQLVFTSEEREKMMKRMHELEMDLSEESSNDKDKRLEEDIVRAALSGQNAVESVKSVIRAHVMEAVAIQIKEIIKKVPFPLNLVLAAGAGIVVGRLVDKALDAIPEFERGGMIEEYANGGMVHGRSHAQGGEKFAVGGRVVELEGGEAVINKRSTAMFRNQLSAMNAAGGGVKFADGGMLNMPQFSQQQFNALGQNQMMGAVASGNKVVVVESDITESQNSVSVIQSDARL